MNFRKRNRRAQSMNTKWGNVIWESLIILFECCFGKRKLHNVGAAQPITRAVCSSCSALPSPCRQSAAIQLFSHYLMMFEKFKPKSNWTTSIRIWSFLGKSSDFSAVEVYSNWKMYFQQYCIFLMNALSLFGSRLAFSLWSSQPFRNLTAKDLPN